MEVSVVVESSSQLQELADSSESWLRGKIDDAEVDKCIKTILGTEDATVEAVSTTEDITGVTGTVICAIFYWRVTLDTPDRHHYVGNAGGFGNAGGGGLQGGALKGVPDLATLYRSAVSFQFNSAAVALNVNFFDGNSKLVGTFVGGGAGICLGAGGGSGSWTT